MSYSGFGYYDARTPSAKKRLIHPLFPQNMKYPKTTSGRYYLIRKITRGRLSRIMLAAIPSPTGSLTQTSLSQAAEATVTYEPDEGGEATVTSEIERVYQRIHGTFEGKYGNVLTEKERKKQMKNISLFKDMNKSEMTDKDLWDKINSLKGPISSPTIIYVWEFFHIHERRKYIALVKELEDTYKIKSEHFSQRWKKNEPFVRAVLDKLMASLLRIDESEMDNIQEFSSAGFLYSRWEFLRYLGFKRKEWARVRKLLKEKGTRELEIVLQRQRKP
ncbi:hypothetical protein C922_03843 [Plasmodium inui San Antonio 1]|uniref:Plasmodium RESA N-terminal domain-containing protein n=1 Tax=Plasmodium inui San Antonio 1 TaxID=1237626 RepID=W7A2E8_9APIC|nr:hypothetical protein C922_03843 [Plasmodium inui San Antonio 1]EUD65860.1 hypothetical protein C922_03843 [Plasmodium inui San Antonio 1]